MTLKLGQFDGVLNKEHFYGKIMQKICTKSQSQIPELKTAIGCKKVFSKQDILKKDYQKTLTKLILFFLLNPVHCNGQDYEKQKGPGTDNQRLFRL